ncbi:hypothetical protein GI584_18635 [Gracilibacillus salitolerans]|uniref:Uncharacterized protein n=1 Tax=Gracilibacillus salitolerans TaxID=2663022 RepID=A0A5Q2TPH7_9BACI|nr:hypothetical protein [Gracilibacillus salitolerans]QGH35943.1 hypothetical protein GI584_18635 [Gracilibacillus salitolerans]
MIIDKLISEKKQVDMPPFTIQHKMDNKTPKDFHSNQAMNESEGGSTVYF